MAKAIAKQPPSRAEDFVFLNVPYDAYSVQPFLAYVCGICGFGLIPRATLELQGETRRLDRIVSLIESCGYSMHDMSRVELDTTPPPTPRFNMPFELGLSVLHCLGGAVRVRIGRDPDSMSALACCHQSRFVGAGMFNPN
jgi:hypothetical protein